MPFYNPMEKINFSDLKQKDMYNDGSLYNNKDKTHSKNNTESVVYNLESVNSMSSLGGNGQNFPKSHSEQNLNLDLNIGNDSNESYLSSNSSISTDVNSNIKVEYISYEDLKPFNKEENIKVLFQTCLDRVIRTDSHWIDIFSGIDALRRLLKFYPDVVIDKLSLLTNSLIKHSKSIRSNVAKISLLLITEIFQIKIVEKEDLLIAYLPLLLQINGQKEKRFLNEQAEKALNEVVKNYSEFLTISLILKSVKEKNFNTSASAFKTLEKLIHTSSTDKKFSNSLNSNTNLVQKDSIGLETINSHNHISSVSKSSNERLMVEKFQEDQLSNLLAQCSDIFDMKKEPYYKRSLFIFSWIVSKLNKEKKDSVVNFLKGMNLNSGKVLENCNRMAVASKLNMTF